MASRASVARAPSLVGDHAQHAPESADQRSVGSNPPRRPRVARPPGPAAEASVEIAATGRWRARGGRW